MQIIDFDIEKGIYSFEFSDLITESHSHPVVELIHAKKGSFTVESAGDSFQNISFAIIDANTKHKVHCQNSMLSVLMVESYNPTLLSFLSSRDIEFENGLFLEKEYARGEAIISATRDLAFSKHLKKPEEERVATCMAFIEENELGYKNLITSLTDKVFLSESRISHLFKLHMGVSIKKYLVWNKLKRAIKSYLDENANFTEASIQNGFFDQAHLSNSFKNVLGISPAKAYNSRILQS